MSIDRDDWDRDEREALDGVRDQLELIRERHRDDPSLDVLRAARADVLPGDLQGRVDEHLAESAWSRALVDGLDQDDAALDPSTKARMLSRLKQEVGREGKRATGRQWFRPVLVGSVLAASAALVWLLVLRPAISPAPESSEAVSVPPEAPPYQLAFAKPEIRLSMTALTWRGAADANPLLADLKPAFDAYRQSNYAAVERELAPLAERYPESIEVLFYQGVSRLYLDDAAGAIESLSAAEAVADSTFLEDVRYYRAVAEQHAGNTAGARERLDALCREKGASAARACESLAQLESSSAQKP